MTKKVHGLSLLLAGCLGLSALGMSSPREDLTLVVVPERYSVIQVAFDLADKRPAVLVAYRGDAQGNPELYAWNGKEWVGISQTEFSEATFLRVLPRRAVLVGDESLLPASVIDGASWAPQVWQVPSIQTDDLVNSFGKIFKFRKSEWNWFASRYKLDLEDQNADRRKDSWYFHPYIEDRPIESGDVSPAVDPVEAAPVPDAEIGTLEVPAVDDIPDEVEDTDVGPEIEPIEDVYLPK